MKKTIEDFLNDYESVKSKKISKDELSEYKKEFKECWNTYISNNSIHSKQTKNYLIRGYELNSAKLLFDYLDSKYQEVKNAKDELVENYTGANEIPSPSRLFDMFVLFTVLNNFENERSKLKLESNKLSNQILILENEEQKLNQLIESKNNEINNLNQMIIEQKKLRSVDINNEMEKSKENNQKIANELKHCYKIFNDTKSKIMSVELGEILRDQLDEIYDVLLRNDINVGE